MTDTNIKGLGHLIKLLHPSEDDYYAAVGKLITSYAKAEAAANIFTRKLSGLSDESARFIFGGMRLADLTERLKNLAKYHNHESCEEIENILKQLDIIKSERNKIAHMEAEYKHSIGIELTNISTAKSLGNTSKEIFTIEHLSQMESDCIIIYFRFYMLTHGELELSEEIINWLRSPWSYRPAKQITHDHTRRSKKKK